jgi:2-iminobutanoate/2-iminopropanoate deaminase
MIKPVATTNAPEAIGPYSQAVVHNGIAYLSGQIPLDPSTMKIVEGDIVVQTERVFENLRAVLEAAGSGFDKVLKMTVFLKDMADFPKMNEVYGKHFRRRAAGAEHGASR